MGTDRTEGRPDMGGLYPSHRQDASGAPLHRKPGMTHIMLTNSDVCRESQSTRKHPFEAEQDGRVAASWTSGGERSVVDSLRLCVAFRTFFSGQIRMHALHLGHPVMGDSLYGTEEGKAKSDRLLLHARRISFPHVRVKTRSHPFVTRVARVFDQSVYVSSGLTLLC